MGRWQLRVSVLFYLHTIFNFVKSIVVLIFTDLLDHGEDMVEVSIGEAVDGKEGEHLQTIELLVRSVSSKIYIQFYSP